MRDWAGICSHAAIGEWSCHGGTAACQKKKRGRAQMRHPANEELGGGDFRARMIPDGRVGGVPARIERVGGMVQCHEHHDDAAHGIDGGQTGIAVCCCRLIPGVSHSIGSVFSEPGCLKSLYKLDFTSLPWWEGLREGDKIDNIPSTWSFSHPRRQMSTAFIV
jgi:hypothetical protein